jgi:DNA helicase II / ATP-dependent DNA helicase PcrA
VSWSLSVIGQPYDGVVMSPASTEVSPNASAGPTLSLFDLRGRVSFRAPEPGEAPPLSDHDAPQGDDDIDFVGSELPGSGQTAVRPRRRSASPEELLSGLNTQQHDAVMWEGAPLVVVAGAGSGKTRVLTRRIAYLIGARRVSPFAIMAITFTNKAAGEMKQRVAELVGPVAEKMWVCTFHSACVRILRRDSHRLGYRSSFTIYDQSDAVRLTQFVLRDLNLDPKKFPPRTVHAAISAAKNELLNVSDYTGRAANIYERKIAEVYAEYQRRLLAASAMDFDDLLVVAVELLRTEPDVLSHYRTRFQHVLVDEYQDTNAAQNELVRLLASEHQNVTVVGDGDQSIYRFRGADVRNILEFDRIFPARETIVLEQNYRSTQNILDAANAVIEQNTGREKKRLWSDIGTGEQIVRFHAEDERDEAGFLVREIDRLRQTESRQWGDFAVFYRTNAAARPVEEQLTRLGIPYRVVGGTKFYDRREVKDLLAYLRVIANPSDEVSLKRVINVPKRGVGDTSIGRLDAWARMHGKAYYQAMQDADAAGLNGKAFKGVNELLRLLDGLRDVEGGPAELIDAVLDRTGYRNELEAEGGIEAQGRLDNLTSLIGEARQHETLQSFLETTSLSADSDEIPDDETQVTLMTLHTAKGLEFPVVFLVGMEDGVFPHVRSLGEPGELEEERRLAYVGITRARERLYLTHAWCRSLFGATQYNPMSRFINEIPQELISVQGARQRGGNWNDAGRSWDYREERGRSSQRPDEPTGRVFGSSTSSHHDDIVEAALRGGKASPAKTTGAEKLALAVGDKVVHGKYGEGTISMLTGEGDKAEVAVNFPGLGVKQFLLAWAPFKKA